MSKTKDFLMEIEEKINDLRKNGCDWDEVEFELRDDGYDSFTIAQAIACVKENE